MTQPVFLEARSFKLDSLPAAPAAPAAPSLELTASDGTGLVLVSLSARVVIEDPLAFTELHLVFHNPQPRQLEGRFRIGLPSGASVSRFAMRIGSGWQEGEVVERQAARRAYEDFLHRRQDPALLEHEAGNEFSARVFPIEANSPKEIIVSYSHELTKEGDAYKLPLVGLPEVQTLEIRALVGRTGAAEAAVSSLGGTSASWQVVEVRKTGWKPDVDFEVRPRPSGRAGLRHESLAVVRVKPELPAEPDEIGSLLVLLDTSASRALGYERQVKLVDQLVSGLARGAGANVPVTIACFDQGVDVVFDGKAADFNALKTNELLRRMALGASDLTGALRWAADRKEAVRERVLLVTDGVATAGDTEAEKIAETAKALSAAGVKRMDVLAVGGLRDDAALKRLVTAGLERDGTVVDGDLPLVEIASRLTRATRSGIQVEVPGAQWVWPTRLDGVQPGDAALVYADVPAGKPVRVLLDKKPVGTGDLALDPVEKPLLERAWVNARIQRLEEMRARPDTDPDVRAGLQKQIVDLSVKHRVLSPYTALLVLETEWDYQRFQIDRNALSDILSVGLSGIEVLRRSASAVPAAAPEPVKAAPPEAKPRPQEERRMKRRSAPRRDEEGALDFRSSEVAGPQASFGEVEAEQAEFEDAGERTRHTMVADGIMDLLEAAPAAAAPAFAAMADDDLAAMSADAPGASIGAAPEPMMAEEMPRAARPASGAPAARPAPRRAPEPPAEAPPPMPARSASPLQRLASAVTDFAHRLVDRGPPADSPPPPASPAAPPRAEAPPPPMAQPPAPPPPPPAASRGVPFPSQPEPEQEPPALDSWTGTFREVMALVLAGKGKEALARALSWREGSPGDVLALIAIGEAAELTGDLALAARAYGSIVDLFPSRADLRRFAGERLSRLAAKDAQSLAIDTYRKAVESRPDHPSGHRLLGMALLRAGRVAEAFEAIATGQARSYPSKFPGIPRILAEDLGLAAAAWIRAEPSKKDDILGRLARAGASLEDGPSVRFVLVWETDANDVDFHIHDAAGGHAYFREKVLPSGGELYADVTQGYGPECFTIRGAPGSRAYPYKLQAHYYRQGPMGYGMGALQIVEHDGSGGFIFEERPYIVMKDGAYVDLGTVTGPVGGVMP